MAKKKKKKGGGSLAERLSKLLSEASSGDAAVLAEMANMSAEDFDTAFGKAQALAKSADPREIAKLPADFQIAFLLLAEKEQDDDQLNDLFSMTKDKPVKKEARRILHRLRSQGVDVALAEDGGSSILDREVAVAEPELPCYLTAVTGTGSRIIWMARYVHGGVSVYQAEINDTEGLPEFSGGVIGRNRYRGLAREMTEKNDVPLLTIGYPEARKHIANAVAISHDASKALPDGYLEASKDLPETEDFTLGDPRELFPSADFENKPELAREAGNLHDLVEFSDWYPSEEALKAIHEKFKEVESSTLTINDEQKAEQIKKALDQAIEDLVGDAEQRTVLAGRLFTMAAYFQLTDRNDTAQTVAAAAWQLEDPEFKPLDSAFFNQMINKLFKSPEEIVKQMAIEAKDPKEKPPEEPSNLIVPP